MKKGRNQKGFTLVELMVVVVIIGILAAIAVPIYNSVSEKAERSAVEANLRTIDGAIMMYYAADENNAQLSTTNQEGLTTLVSNGFLKSVPKGPGEAVYGITGNKPAQKATVKGKVGGTTLPEGTTLDTLNWTTGGEPTGNN